MSGLLALTALLVAGSPGAPAPPAAAPSCATYTRSSTNTPPLVHKWLARSADDHVRVCQPPASGPGELQATTYAGESALRRQGGVCSYARHGLLRVDAGNNSRLERDERGDVEVMALAGEQCPEPHPTGADAYVPTYDVSARAFESIMELWASVAASALRFDRELACCEGTGAGAAVAVGPAALGDSGRRLRGAIDGGRMKSASVTRIVRVSASVWQRRYALFVANPDDASGQARLYVIYLRKPLRGPYHITAVADTN